MKKRKRSGCNLRLQLHSICFLLEVNFDKSTIRLHFLFISFILAKFSKKQISIVKSSTKCLNFCNLKLSIVNKIFFVAFHYFIFGKNMLFPKSRHIQLTRELRRSAMDYSSQKPAPTIGGGLQIP